MLEIVPVGVLGLTFTTSIKIPLAPDTWLDLTHTIVPVPPGGTLSVRVHPAGTVADTNVVFAGMGSITTTFCAVSGPLFPGPML